MNSQLDIDIRIKKLLKFVLPSIMLMVFLSIYTMVGGIFVSRFAGTHSLSALNMVYPVTNVALAMGLMLGTGGSAICARKLGMGKQKEAKQDFTAIVLFGLCLGVLLFFSGLFFRPQLVRMLGVNETLFELALAYIFPVLLLAPALIMQATFQIFLIAAGKPGSAFVLILIGGVVTVSLNILFIIVLDWGVAGAGWASGLGNLASSLYGVFCFFFSKNAQLTFTKPIFRLRVLLQCCANGSSEMVTNLALAVTGYLYNVTMLRLAGEDGVAAITIILYAQFMLSALYLGYSSGVAPLISYNYGCQNHVKLRRLFRFSFVFTATFGLLSFLFALVFAPLLTGVFSPSGSAVNTLATGGLRIFALSFLVAGMNIFSSSMFTAFSNGLVSASISFLRTFVFISALLLILPNVLGVLGVWLAVPLAEAFSFLVCLFFLRRYRKVYHY